VPLIAKELRIERETLPFRLPKELATKVSLYARFIDSSRDYVVVRILEYVIGRDREFAAWLKEHGPDAAQALASTDAVRRHAGRPRTTTAQTTAGEADHVPAHR
jgi:hypothetical protein